jgi:hypothetical protein
MSNFAASVFLALLGASAIQEVVERMVEWQAISTLTSKGAEISEDTPRWMPILVDPYERNTWKRIGRRFLIASTQEVKGIWISNTSLDDPDLELLKYLPHLEFVDITDPDITGWGLVSLKDCPSLKSLSIRTPSFEGSIGVSDLKCLNQLISLEIHVRSGQNLRGLAEMSRLSYVIVHELSIVPDDLTEAKQLKHLTDFGLVDLRLREALAKLDFSNWPGLRCLFLSSVLLTSEEWDTIFANTGLIGLRVADTVLFPGQLEGIGRLENLRVLQFRNIRFDPHLTLPSFQLPRLEFLAFERCALRDDLLDMLAKSPNLRTLVLDGTSISDDSLEGLTFGPQFESLYIDDAIFASNGESLRSRNPGVNVLRLSKEYPKFPGISQ